MLQKNGMGKIKSLGLLPNLIIIKGLAIALIFTITTTYVLTYRTISNDIVDLKIGDVVPKDILAPRQIVYNSPIKTKESQDRAKNSIATIYTPPDPKIVRNQVLRLRQIFDYLDAVRADPYSSLPQKREWVRAISNLSLNDIVVDQIVILGDLIWAETKQESIAILDEVLRTEIKENQVNATRRRLPTRIALDTPESQSTVIVAITENLIQPNTFPDLIRTQTEQEAAIQEVKPVVVKIEKNELIVSTGQIVRPEDMEALQELGLQQLEFNWLRDFASPAVLVLLMTFIIGLYLLQYLPRIILDSKRLVLLACLLLAFIAVAKFVLPYQTINGYLFPIAALSMMVVTLINVQLAFILTTIVAVLTGYLSNDASPTTFIIYLILSGWTGALALSRGRHVSVLLWAGLYVGLINVVVIISITLSTSSTDIFLDLGIAMLEGLFNGIFSAGLALIGVISIGRLMGITTTMQLLDLSSPTHPLLRQLLLKAPGTYHHSLMVSNLGEQAAERIGADALLVRVMAYYHDIGKIQRPYFFVENQPHGINVHEKLDPKISAQIIISHVTDGIELAKKYQLPQVIQDGIIQHHGTTMVKYFYYQAVMAANEKNQQVNEDDFRYPGPRPQDKENAILMLADVSESTIRAIKPNSVEEIDEIVQKMITDKLDTGQLNQCDLTIADLYKIRTAFVDILQGVHHPRIKYPAPVKPNSPVKSDDKAVAPETKKEKEQPVLTVTESSKDGSFTLSGTSARPPSKTDTLISPVRPASLVKKN